MSKRNIGQEIIQGLEEIKAWKRGELKLKTHTVEIPTARKRTYKASVRGTATHARPKAA